MHTAQKWVSLGLVAVLCGAADPPKANVAPPQATVPPVANVTPPLANVVPPPNITWSGLEEQATPPPTPTPSPSRRRAVRATPLPNSAPNPADKPLDNAQVAKLNTWTLGLAGGQRESDALEFAINISSAVNDGDNLHVLPIVTRGPAENVESLLYLKGVDAAVINADTLQQFQSKIPDIDSHISYILSLYPSELQILARPEIKSVQDLRGKKVNFDTEGTASAYSGPLIFTKLNLADVQQTFIPQQVAMEQMRNGTDDMEAVVFVASKPVYPLLKEVWPEGFHLLAVPSNLGFYLPASLTPADYPQLISQGQEIETIAVPTILATYNWPEKSDRYKRVARLVDYLFDRITVLQGPSFHPQWKDVVLNAEVPGLNRFHEAQVWLDRTAVPPPTPQASATPPSPSSLDTPTAADAKLFQQFLQWRKTHPQ